MQKDLDQPLRAQIPCTWEAKWGRAILINFNQ